MHCIFSFCFYFVLVAEANNATLDIPPHYQSLLSQISIPFSLVLSFYQYNLNLLFSHVYTVLTTLSWKYKDIFLGYYTLLIATNEDVIAVPEALLQSDGINSFIASVTPPGYKCTCVRCDGRGIGLGSFIRYIDFMVLLQQCVNAFESIFVQLAMGNAQETTCFQSQFSKEDFSCFVEGAASSCCQNIILGDLHLHLDKEYTLSQIFSD